jgi:transcriptional regulator with XRE-family HTH domain
MLKRGERTHLAVRRALKTKGKTQRWLAGELGIAESTLSDVLRHRHQPSLTVALSLERITGVPVERFARG